VQLQNGPFFEENEMLISEAIERLEELRSMIGDSVVVIESGDQSHHGEDCVQYELAAFECQNVTPCACGYVSLEKENSMQVVAVF